MMRTISEVRNAFWRDHPKFKGSYRVGKRQNDYVTDIRTAFVDYVDMLSRDGQISDELANKVTL